MSATEFERATAAEPLGAGAYAAVSDARWEAPIGPNGGYLAAIVLRAMEAEVGDPARPARSITLHYLRPPAPGPLRVEVTVQRAGRRLSTLTARVLQEARLCVLAIAAFSGPLGEPVDAFAPAPPEVPRVEALEAWPRDPGAPPITHRAEMVPALGGLPFSGGDEALAGGWMRLVEPPPVDAPLLALYADLWLPPVFARLTRPVAAPTIDLTIHFRAPAAVAALDRSSHVLGVFRSDYAAGGLVEEDGELWSPDGVLLAHSRQLALLVPIEAPA